ncbi:hypothetical protein Cgig2_026232 [Carnegiea gigantea]|uniref:Uncharacterized protein n=1 Tax=Carnegiea gigantea TaxID=171969 RepID=A0A9Q1QKH2_9CARY|nr:hypothetical protein Cgig2_026232 [Carnegiea gigantea]
MVYLDSLKESSFLSSLDLILMSMSSLTKTDAESRHKEFKKSHSKQIEGHGMDNVSMKEVYRMVRKEHSGNITGLEARQQPAKSEGESSELTSEVELQEAYIQQHGTVDEEIEHLKASNDSLTAEIERMKVEAIEREKKLREELLQMLCSQLPQMKFPTSSL